MGALKLTLPIRGWPTGELPSEVHHSGKINASNVSPGNIMLGEAVSQKAKAFCLVSLLFGSSISLSNTFL